MITNHRQWAAAAVVVLSAGVSFAAVVNTVSEFRAVAAGTGLLLRRAVWRRDGFELADELTVNVDAVQMGVGGDNSWGARPHRPYLPGEGAYRLSFILRGAFR